MMNIFGKTIFTAIFAVSYSMIFAENIHFDSDPIKNLMIANNFYSNRITEFIRSKNEINFYKEIKLTESLVGDKSSLIQENINWSQKEPADWVKNPLPKKALETIGLSPELKGNPAPALTNLQRAKLGYAPLDKNYIPYELHHIGQKNNSPLAELTYNQHREKKNYSMLHDTYKKSEIDRGIFKKEQSLHWQERVSKFETENYSFTSFGKFNNNRSVGFNNTKNIYKNLGRLSEQGMSEIMRRYPLLTNSIRVLSKSTRFIPFIGVALEVYTDAKELYGEYNLYRSGLITRNAYIVHTVGLIGGIAGGFAGAWAGAKLGAFTGGIIGTVVAGPVGTVIGSFAGGIIGGTIGGIVGYCAGKWVFTRIATNIFNPNAAVLDNNKCFSNLCENISDKLTKVKWNE